MRIRATGSAMKRGGGGAGGCHVDCVTALIKMGKRARRRGDRKQGGDNSHPAGSLVSASEESRVLAGASGAYLDATKGLIQCKAPLHWSNISVAAVTAVRGRTVESRTRNLTQETQPKWRVAMITKWRNRRAGAKHIMAVAQKWW